MRVTALIYHDIIEAGRYDASGFPGGGPARYKLDRTSFENHLDAISRATERSPTQAGALADGGESNFLLTFDDGGASALRIGEMLSDREWSGHFFIPTDYIGHQAFLDVGAIRALRDMGHQIGSHSCSHPTWMSRLGWEQIRREWGTSIDVLTEILGEQVMLASVPGGHYSRDVARAASSAGITMLFTSEPRDRTWSVDGCLVFGRYSVQRATSARTVARLAAGARGPRIRQRLSWSSRQLAKTIGGERYTRLRTAILER